MNNKSKFKNVYEDMLFTRLESMDMKLFETEELCNVRNEFNDIYKMIKNFLPSEHKNLYKNMKNKGHGNKH